MCVVDICIVHLSDHEHAIIVIDAIVEGGLLVALGDGGVTDGVNVGVL